SARGCSTSAPEPGAASPPQKTVGARAQLRCMSSGLIEQQPTHPLVRLVDALGALLEEDAEAPAWTLTPSELTDLLPRLARATNRLDALELRLLREADRHQVGDRVGAANTAGWWAV